MNPTPPNPQMALPPETATTAPPKPITPPTPILSSPPPELPLQARRSGNPVLRFSPYAWAKLLAFRDYGPTEIAGFGVATGLDMLLIADFVTVPQRCTAATVAMDDEGVADYFEQQVDRRLKPQQFARLWLHTHPGISAQPSTTDEETFERVFCGCDWAVMAILARGGQTYARLRFGGPSQPRAQMLIPVEVDFSIPFPAADHIAWRAEYDQHIMPDAKPSLCELLSEVRRSAGDGKGHALTAAERSGRDEVHRRREWPESSDDPDFSQWLEWRDAQALAELEFELAACDELAQPQESEVPS